MQSLAHTKTVRQALVARAGMLTLLAAVTAVLALTHGCNQGQQGDRCNPTLALANDPYGANDDECGSGLTCQQPALCPENYCCPTSGPASSPFCMPGCNGGQASICDAGGDADCASLGDGG
jgi:hypothetical protein